MDRWDGGIWIGGGGKEGRDGRVVGAGRAEDRRRGLSSGGGGSEGPPVKKTSTELSTMRVVAATFPRVFFTCKPGLSRPCHCNLSPAIQCIDPFNSSFPISRTRLRGGMPHRRPWRPPPTAALHMHPTPRCILQPPQARSQLRPFHLISARLALVDNLRRDTRERRKVPGAGDSSAVRDWLPPSPCLIRWAPSQSATNQPVDVKPHSRICDHCSLGRTLVLAASGVGARFSHASRVVHLVLSDAGAGCMNLIVRFTQSHSCPVDLGDLAVRVEPAACQV